MARQVAVRDPMAVMARAGKEAEERLKQLFELIQVASADERLRSKFFPNGIELLRICIEGGISENLKVKFELEIAGPNPNENASGAAIASSVPGGDPASP